MSLLPFDITAGALVAALLGISSHLTYFMHGEHHTLAVLYIQVAFAGFVLSSAGLTLFSEYTLLQSFGAVTILLIAYLCSLLISVLIYRASFHRLHHFPGPPLAKLGKLWHCTQVLHQNNYVKLDKWHNQYGDFVRIGPDEVSTIHPDAAHTVLGPKSLCQKGSFYDMSFPKQNLHTTRDHVLHDKRRKVWDQGLSIKSLREYQARITSFAELLADQLAAFGGEAVNATPWLIYFGFDVMADVAFSKSFNMLQKGKEHIAIKMLRESMSEGIAVISMVWLVRILVNFPYSKMVHFRDWCKQQADERRIMDVTTPDIKPMSIIPSINEDWLTGDSRLVVVAGSDTVTATLAHVVYHLASDQSQQQKLRTELKGAIENQTFDSLTGTEHLNAVINETLRLHPPVPSGLARKVPPEGVTIGKTFIPGECIITVPFWSMQRSPKAWVHPHDFIPERWYSKPELVLNKNAYAPFSLGKYNCTGKGLAMMELRIAITVLVTRFEISFAPGEDGTDLFQKSDDVFTIAPGPLSVIFKTTV